jgi:uncharacterized protein YecT (DUF1311 family)
MENLMASLMVVIGLCCMVSLEIQPRLAWGAPVQEHNVCHNPQTQRELNACAVKEYKEADDELNKMYQHAISRLDKEQRSQLRIAQRAWVKFRDAHCKFASMESGGGTMYQTLYYECLKAISESRITDLEKALKSLLNR